MGISSYFKGSKAADKKETLPTTNNEKSPVAASSSAPTSPRAPYSPRPGSLAPSTRSRRTVRSTFLDEIKHDVMCSWLFQQQCIKMWIGEYAGDCEGTLIRKSPTQYVASPPELAQSSFAQGAHTLGVHAAMTVNSRVVKTFLMWNPESPDIPLSNGLRVQILPSMDYLPRARKHQYAAVVAAEGLLVVWDDDANHIVERATFIVDDLAKIIWESGNDDARWDDTYEKEKDSPSIHTEEVFDEETGHIKPQERATHLQNSVLVGITLALITIMVGAGFRQIAIEIAVDNGYIRCAFLLLTPVQIFFTLFFAQVIVGCIAQMIGPIKQMKANSKYYSAKCSPRLQTDFLPHITIQCPVYKEGLEAVIMPTVKSIKAAMSTYELQGGSSNIFINDDGLQLISEEEREARIDFYTDNNIGWVARPKHGENGFVRKGKFKKASNMNYGLMVSCRVEEILSQTPRHADWNASDEADAYGAALTSVLEAEEGRAWADGNIRMGDYILLIDSDTQVPTDCLLDACSEMEQCPEVGIMQFSSGVMQVTWTYFENGITFFTNLIYTAIRYTVSNGDVAPFVGHNAILRWSAIQQVSYMDEDNYEKFWSESHVSEDFDMSLRLQVNGYIIRLAAWAGDGFKEGVSLTVYDELARWEKYAYGCNELLFHPIRFWFVRGPFTPLFRSFLFSNIRFTSKVTIVSYIGTYYAIGAAWILTTANYFAVGWFNGYLDKYYIDSWKVWFSIIIVFNGLGNVSLAIMRYRVGEKSFIASITENLKWILMFAIFLGGLSLHVSSALLAHMFEYNMQWGATAKEAEWSNFFVEVPRVLKRFKYSIAFALLGIVGMVVLAVAPFVPWDWRIDDFIAILPMSTVVFSHLCLPVALNPALMTFSW
ncbi:glycosyl transferase family group 2-domain-containing protein [Elsinoe ampelina]|uniref:Glycosyl transferase family group 2-domain-containing protein n=1 Tax=Elsinoe ampelina TaxID=302913 RepID=A0A6A6GJP8_9PEZI|nr:glycosyl transferase family group 2-domain-containing protein [Elsinoe ampelina]